MRTATEPIEIEHLGKLNQYGPDDLFICCASFEERCLSSAYKISRDFRVRFAVIFVIEEPLYQKEVDANLFKLQTELGKRTGEGIFVITCHKRDPIEGIAAFKTVWKQCKPKNPDESFVTVDISGFTKIYLLGLLHYLVSELNIGIPRLIHTTQSYAPAKLTHGVEQISTVTDFFGTPSVDRPNILVLFLGFESERAMAVWKQYNPSKTIVLITSPPRNGNLEYVTYAEENNAYLISQPNVEVRNAPPDNPYTVKSILETVYTDTKGSFNMVIGPFGTKPQAVGVFLFCMEHRRVQVVYSFPEKYSRSYLNRKPGETLLLPLAPPV